MGEASTLASEICGPSFNPEDIDCNGKVVIYRADLNVPVLHGHITDWSRIDGTLPTLKLLLSKGARVAVISHFGRPKPEKQSLEEMRKEYSLQVVAEALGQKLPAGVFQGLAADCTGPEAEEAISKLQAGQASHPTHADDRFELLGQPAS
jgi:phosphoglycerate kinase